MKLFDPYAALRKIEMEAGTPATFATTATSEGIFGGNVAKVAVVAAPEREIAKTEPERTQPVSEDFKHGLSIGGRPMTWTGKVVSLEDWRQLSEWEKHGPDGRVWNGKTQQWELLRS